MFATTMLEALGGDGGFVALASDARCLRLHATEIGLAYKATAIRKMLSREWPNSLISQKEAVGHLPGVAFHSTPIDRLAFLRGDSS